MAADAARFLKQWPMKRIVIILAVAVLACSRPQPASDPYPNYLIKDEEWIVYEGTLPSSYGPDVHVELSLYPGAPGLDSRYQMSEYPDPPRPNKYDGWIGSRGRYMVLHSGEGQIVHINDRSFIKGISVRGEIRMPDIGKETLYLQSVGEHKLVFVDDDFQKTSDKYVLTRRASPLFTVEGYFSVYNDTTDFFERNTGKEWAVSKLAAYNEAVGRYPHLSREKFEGVYLKALAYTVLHLDQDGNEIDALVFKRILEMDSTARIH